MRTGNISKQRIMGQAKKLNNEKLSYLRAEPLADDLYTWHFTIQGPQNTEFHQGIYHGQILLPYEYPFKPPDIVFMNKNGRFQTNTKICLTITQYHPEEWNSAWTIRTMLEAVISLFSENIQGVGALTATPDVRKFLAKSSHSFVCEKCGVIKNHLPPRGKYEEIKQKEIEQKPQVIERKMSEVQNKKQELPQIQRTFSQNVNPLLFKQPAMRKPQDPSSIRDFKMRQQIREEKEDEIQKRVGPEIIYIKQVNPYGTNLHKVTTIIQQIQLNTSFMDRVSASLKWV